MSQSDEDLICEFSPPPTRRGTGTIPRASRRFSRRRAFHHRQRRLDHEPPRAPRPDAGGYTAGRAMCTFSRLISVRR